jgi:hypothetical protein
MSGILLRRATLIDVDYHVVKEVTVPVGIRGGDTSTCGPWPAVIRYDGRVYTQYHYTMPDTIEAKRKAEFEATYREVTVFDVV